MIRCVIVGLVTMLVTFAAGHAELLADETNAGLAQVRTDSLGDPLPERAALLRLGTKRFQHPSTVIELALSPDEKTVVTIGREELMVWDAATGKLQWRAKTGDVGIGLTGAAYGVRALTFASDNSRFYTPGRHNEFMIWNVASGQHEVIAVEAPQLDNKVNLEVHDAISANPKVIDVTSDGRRIALGSSQGILVCDEKGKVSFEIPNAPAGRFTNEMMSGDRLLFGGHYSYARFSPDQKLLAAVTSDSPEEIVIYDAETGKKLKQIRLKSRLTRLAFTPDSRQIATTEHATAVRLYAIDSGQEIWSFVIEPPNKAESYTCGISFLPASNLIAACAPIGSDNEIRLLNAADGKEVGKLKGHSWKPWALATTKGNVLYSSGWDGAIRRWDVDQRQQLPLPQGVRGTSAVTASPDGRVLAHADDLGTIHVLRAEDGTELRTIKLPGAAYTALSFSSDSNYLAGGGMAVDNVHVAVWEANNGKLVHRWDWPKGKDPHSDVECICFRPDGKQLAAAVFRQSAAYLWDLTTGEQIARLTHDHVYGLSFSPDNETLATAGWDKIIRLWDANRGEQRRENKVDDSDEQGDPRMYTVCHAPAGGILATAHLDGKVRVWNAADMQLLKQFTIKGRFIFGSIAFSPDGSLLATGTMGGEIALWDPLTAEQLWEVGRHESYVYTLAFGADNRTLVSGGSDSVCYLWDLQPRGQANDQDLNFLWKKLSTDGPAAYEAMWAMKRIPDRAVPFLGSKLRPITRVMDLDRITKGLPAEEAEHRQRLVRMMAEKDPKVALASVARWATVSLGQMGTADAISILRELANRDPNSDLGKMAAAAVARFPTK